ncbi:hypothetical protein [Spiroplasma turonicum]|uniref:Uncharacterized protein n=1 Tax=Spiroplasma turonicum TaxID=216946 RepID=A0A0K1P5Y2_9MOLU|nr:hypothetical protein [Spiroplasma turonicum]AKU79670.1 hypothetical protein STURON_00424 [Spiroplasma turonicum]ALX70690.1 hypothetical protein STURO_v1c04220 [Spiroplasma turonicum]
MKKTILITCALLSTIGLNAALFLKISNNSVTTSNNSNTNNSSNEVNKYLDQMPDIKTDLGSLSSLEKSKIIETFKSYNKKFANDEISIKQFGENFAEITIKNFIGKLKVTFKISSFQGLFKISDLGIISEYTNESVVSKIEEKNESFKIFDKSSLQYSFKGINIFEVYSKNINKSYNFNITPKNLFTIIPNLTIQSKINNPYDKSEIINALASINPILNFEKSLLLVDENSMTYNGAVVYTNKSFDNKSRLTVNYQVNQFTNMINTTNIGEINSYREENIINDVLNKNSILRDYYKNKYLNIVITNKGAWKSSLKITKVGTSTSSTIDFSYKAANVDILLDNKAIYGNIYWFNKIKSGDEQIKDVLIEKNSLLKDFSKNDLIVNSLSYKSLEPSLEYIYYTFSLTIKNINGRSSTIEGSIRRYVLYYHIKNFDLGKLNWSNEGEVISKLRSANPDIYYEELKQIKVDSFNKGINIEANNDSLVYKGSWVIKMDTDMYKKDISTSVYRNPDNDIIYGGVSRESAYLALGFPENTGKTNVAEFGFTTSTRYQFDFNNSTIDDYANKKLKYSYDFMVYKVKNSDRPNVAATSSELQKFDTSNKEETVPLNKIATSSGYSGRFTKHLTNMKVKYRDWYCDADDFYYVYIDAIIDYNIKVVDNKIKFSMTSQWTIEKGIECYTTLVNFRFTLHYIDIV